MNRKLFVVISFYLLFTCCSTEDPEFVIEPEFQIYLDRFIDEAEKRGVDVDVSKLSIVRAPLADDACGQGLSNYNETGTQRVVIKDEAQCWDYLSSYEQEFLMFHELGHALLGRIHREGSFPDGSPASIMCAATCSANLSNLDLLDARLREYLIDQLFDEFIDPPSWYFPSGPTVYYQEDLGSSASGWEIQNTDCNNYILSQTTLDNEVQALSISASELVDCNGASWTLAIDDPDIKEYSFLRATVNLDLEFVEGKGPSISLLTISIDGRVVDAVWFTSTLNRNNVNGNQKDKKLIVTFPGYTKGTDGFSIILSLSGNSKGTVHFKELLVEVFEP